MKHFLNDIEISPRNVLDFGVQSNYDDDPQVLEIDADKVVLPREALEIVQNHIQTQGVFEGIPYRIEMQTETGPNISLQYYVDLTENPVFRDFEFEVKIKKRLGTDSYFDQANGTSFELLAANGVQFQFIDIPYLIIRDNQVALGITLAISLYAMTEALIQAIRDLAESVQDIIEAVTPSVGAGSVINIGEIITLALGIVAQLAYTALLLIAVIKLAQQMFELLFPKIRFYLGCTIKELIVKGSQYLGYTVQSNLLNEIANWTIMPVPLVKEKNSVVDFIENDLNFSFTKGYPTASDTTPTLGSLVKAVEESFNARTRVLNGVVRIERRDWWANVTTNQILPALNLQDVRQSEYTLNTEDAWKRYLVRYFVDQSDFHTLDFYDPTDSEYSTEPTNVLNSDLVTIKGTKDVRIPFALGVRKNKLNWIEKLAKGFFQVIDEVTGVFGGGTSFAANIQNRIGVTQIGQQFYSTTKILYAVNGKQPENYVSKIRASAVYNKYHSINAIQVNGYEIYSDVPVALRPQEFVSLLDNNYAEIDGVICEIISLRYNDEESKAFVSYKKPNNYASGKVYTLTIND